MDTAAASSNAKRPARRKRARAPVRPPAGEVRQFHKTRFGTIYLGDSLRVFEQHISPNSVDLIVTSPPFGLVRKKDYGNVDSHEYLEWFRPFGETFKSMLAIGFRSSSSRRVLMALRANAENLQPYGD